MAKFSLRKLVTQQLWLYLISQAGITAFRAAALKDNIVDQGGWLQNVLLPWRHMWYLYALMFWMLTVPLLRAIQRRGLLASTVGMAAAIAIGLLGGCVNWPFDLGRVFSFSRSLRSVCCLQSRSAAGKSVGMPGARWRRPSWCFIP